MSSNSTRGRVHILVCGERLRGDDGAALLAAQGLRAEAHDVAEIREVGQLSVEALVDLPEGATVIVADAAAGVAAGEVVIVPLAEIAERAAGAMPASSHSLPPDQVLAIAEEMRGSPFSGVFVGIGGADFGLGEGLSPAVAAGLPALTAALEAEIRRLSAG
ncbi:MAG: hydrogenase maturation protease [Candidatus Limnocylindrales bacterium]|jgi:hydrogenase maturation protease